MNILMIASFLPYPLYSGGHIRLYNLLKLLSKKHTITLICEKRETQTEDDIRAVEKFCKKVITVNREKQWSFQNILKTGFSKNAFLITGHTLPQMREKIAQELDRSSFDVIHAETFYIMQNIPDTKIPIVLVEHNIEYLVYKRYADIASVVIRPFLYIDILKLKHYEQHCWKQATRLVAVSQADQQIMNRQDVVIVPNGVDVDKFRITNYELQMKEKRILFIGDFKWIQNRDAVEWIITQIWPKITKELNLKLWIVGRKIPETLKSLTHDSSIIFDEHAPSQTEKIYQQAEVLLAPIRVGGGTQYKILEAMATGVPVITTSLGIVGLKVRANIDILVADTANEFIQQLSSVLQDKTLEQRVIKNARVVIEKEYDFKIIAEKLDAVYTSTKTL